MRIEHSSYFHCFCNSSKKNLFKKSSFGFLLLFALLFFNESNAQLTSASLDREKILLGEQVQLELKLEQFNSRTDFVDTWFKVKDSTNHVEVIKREPIDTVDVNGLTSYVQKIILTSFDSGSWKIGPLNIIIQNKSTGIKTKLQSSALTLEVLPVDVSDLTSYHPIKEIIDVEHKDYTWLFIAMAASALVLAYVIYRIIKIKNKLKPVANKKVFKGSPLERAVEKLQRLQKLKLTTRQQMIAFHTAMDTIYREYFEESLAINALKITSEELMQRLNVYLQDAHLHSQFYKVIQLNNAVKFAKFLPDEVQSKAALEITTDTLQQIDAIIQKSLGHAH